MKRIILVIISVALLCIFSCSGVTAQGEFGLCDLVVVTNPQEIQDYTIISDQACGGLPELEVFLAGGGFNNVQIVKTVIEANNLKRNDKQFDLDYSSYNPGFWVMLC